MPPPESKQDRWFLEEIHPHEASLRGYLRSSFPAVQDIDDVVQTSYLRVWKAASSRQIASARAFLFRVARNVALDLVRRTQVAPFTPLGEIERSCVIEEGTGVFERLGDEERIELLIDALDALPARTREAMILCKLQGCSYREAATRLGVAEKTVAEQVYRGMQRLGRELERRRESRFLP
jgi:RNA polymerase sigma-70 factor (ECF subfamily)